MSSGDIAAALARLGSATIGESGGLAAHRRLRPAWAGATLAAPAYPVGCTPGDNLAVHVAVTTAPKGSVLVVDVGQVADRGYWGEVLTTAAEAAGLTGLIIDGGVRDVAALEAHAFPVFSSTIALTGASKDKPGTVGVPVTVGGVEVAVGDWVVADFDGVAFVPRGAVDDVLVASQDRRPWSCSDSMPHWCARANLGNATPRVAQCSHERRGSGSRRESGADGGGADDSG